MKIKLINIAVNKLITPSNFAIKKGMDRKVAYYLIKENKIDYTEIDGVMFVVLTEKSRNYKKK